MLDFSYIQNQSDYISIFYNNGTGGTGGFSSPSGGSWQTWTKPRNKCNFIWMMCMGGGAGGAGGVVNSNGNAGASAAITTALFPANLLPDILFVWPGKGGKGGIGDVTTAIAPTTGGPSLVAVRPISSSIYTFPGSSELICSSGRNEGTNGWSTPLIGEKGNGDLGTVLPKLITLGIWNSVNGRDRASPTTALSPLVGGTITCPGTDGAGANQLGNNISSINLGNNLISPTIYGGALLGGKGGNGYWSWKPMFGTGGTGGGSNASGIGGNGGKGAYGCGGGGGGASSTGNKGGDGGDGGDGLVIIATF